MKKAIIIISVLSGMTAAYAQSHGNGGTFRKTVEYSRAPFIQTMSDGSREYAHNIYSKNDDTRILMGDRNADAEFIIELSAVGSYGFRLDMDTTAGKYTLETKRITNKHEVERILDEQYPIPAFTTREYDTMTASYKASVKRRTQETAALRRQKAPALYNIRTVTAAISDSLARAVYHALKSAIGDFRGVGHPDPGAGDEAVNFRVVAGDELWWLEYFRPAGGIERLAGICKQLTWDIEDGCLDEAKYYKLLTGFHL